VKQSIFPWGNRNPSPQPRGMLHRPPLPARVQEQRDNARGAVSPLGGVATEGFRGFTTRAQPVRQAVRHELKNAIKGFEKWRTK
jgi:hypothetical protein